MKNPSGISLASRSWKLFLLTAIAFTLTQCGSDDPKSINPQVNGYNFFVVGGYNEGAAIPGVPAYWKNGELVKLSESSGMGNNIVVAGDNVYVTGFLNEDSDKVKLWTNGELSNFSEGFVTINRLREINGDLYAVGFTNTEEGYFATYWKNGVAHILHTEQDTGNSFAYDIAIVGNDVYVVGSGDHSVTGGSAAKYWKNNVAVEITNGNLPAFGRGIAVAENGDVYVSGMENNVLKVWKNGVESVLGEGVDSNTPSGGIATMNDDVYVVGNETNDPNTVDYKGNYWKNGVKTELPKPAGTASVQVRSMTIIGDDIFVCGGASIAGVGYRFLVWKNFELLAPYDGTFAEPGISMAISTY